jgi:hypothetical protein
MKKFRVMFSVDATVSVEVEAENRESAAEMAWEIASSPCLCHQCADEVETGDLIEVLDIAEVEHE